MTIAIVINTSWNIYNFRMGLVDSLLKSGYKVVAIAPEDDYSRILVDRGCEFIPLKMDNKGMNPIKDLFLIFRLIKIYNRVKPDVVLQYTIKPNIYGTIASVFSKAKVINNISGLGTMFLGSKLKARLAKVLYKISLTFAYHVFFQNQDDQNQFITDGLVNKNKTSVLPGSGVSLEKFTLRNDISVNKPRKFLMVSRLLFDKGIIELIEAIKGLRLKGKEEEFLICGALEPEANLGVGEEQVTAWQNEGLITYHGKVDDIQKYIEMVDCVVLPSYREGTPRSLLEAMALSKPIVTTDVPGCREVLLDGENGFFCEVKNQKSLAESLEKIIALSDEDLRCMGDRSRRYVEEKFDEKIVIGHYFDQIKKLEKHQ